MTHEENIANNAKLKAEWLSHSREAVEGCWYLCESRLLKTALNVNLEWGIVLKPEFGNIAEHRITKTPGHPEYVAPPKVVKVEFEVSEGYARRLLKSLENYARYHDTATTDELVVNAAIKDALAKV